MSEMDSNYMKTKNHVCIKVQKRCDGPMTVLLWKLPGFRAFSSLEA